MTKMTERHCGRGPDCLWRDCACGCDGCDPIGGEARAIAVELRAKAGERIARDLVERAAELLERYPNGNR